MATDELVLDSVGASTKEPKPVADEDVAKEESTQVAEEATTPESVPYSDFQALQSKLDKRLTELQRENETLKAKVVVVPEGPTPQETQRFNDLYNRHQYLSQQMQDAETAEAIQAISYQLGALETSLVDAQATLIARDVGIDPRNTAYREALLSEAIETPKDIERLAWKIKATTTEDYKMSETVKKREADLAKAEMTVDERIQAGIKSGLAALREELGLNATVSVKPAGSSGQRAKLEKELSDYMTSGNWEGALQAQSILAQLTD